jgi:hypothetical protein
MQTPQALLLLTLLTLQLYCWAARPAALPQLQQQRISRQQQFQENPDGEEDDKWNTRPIVGILTQVQSCYILMQLPRCKLLCCCSLLTW